MKVIAITGGIGSGKSVVSRILTTLGHPVYDTDSRAKELMTSSQNVIKELTQTFGASIYTNRGLNKTKLSEIVFNDENALNQLNSIVHPAVKADFLKWIHSQQGRNVVFVETALLYTGRFDQIVDSIWKITAPVPLRVERVKKRNQASEENILKRINAQVAELRNNPKDCIIENDGQKPLIPQVFHWLKSLK